MRSKDTTWRRGFCDGITRRHALKLGASGFIGGLTLPTLFQMEATASNGTEPKAKACIFLFLQGGPSTIDMWDLKPDAPAEIRGPFKPIRTNVTGTIVGEHCHRCARVADKFTILRSHSHNDNGHTTGYHYVLTGYRANFADGANSRVPVNETYPSLGSIVSRELGTRGSMPPYINMPHPLTAGGPGFYGAEHAPFVIESDPVQPDFEVKDLKPDERLSESRNQRRQRALLELEKDMTPAGRAGTMATYYDKARDLISSPLARKAFDLNSEPEKLRAAYGHSSLGQCALLSRRLAEAGCRFIGVDHGSWDTHFSCFPSLEKDLIPHADQAFSALVTDLQDRGMLDSTLVVMMGEMGRTPRINDKAGRDHWSQAQSVLFAGGGIKPGQVIGATDKHASAPTADPVSVADILRTVLHLLGIDCDKTYLTPLGRPVPIV
ncbi:MAG TPA: DUF1501 domain-containing protein [Gemmataceae bacterium]|nr:DUF1501 domain-containing protein [Gemmataceae bacterium]